MTTIAEAIRTLPYFADLPEELILSVCDGSEEILLEPDTVIIEEGTNSEEMYVVVEGMLVVTKHTPAKEVELARLGPGEVVGEMALLDGAPRTATVTAAERTQLIKVPVSTFEVLLRDPRVIRRMFRTVTSRLRDIEDTLRHEERMAALGRMAAQLMHELNNPAAAVGRSTQELSRIYADLGAEAGILAGAHTAGLELNNPEPGQPLSAVARADAEDRLVQWLTAEGIEEPWDLAPAMIDGGWTPELLEEARSGIEDGLASHFVRWIGLRAAAEQVIGEIGIGARRISELVRVVKDYSYLDQAPIQEIDPTEGISDTLVLLKFKLREIDVHLEFEEGLARVEAPGRDLNQVWTNLIDNAADAMDGKGTLTISARNAPDAVVISVSDTGSGGPPEVVERMFDPFFTTKEPGKGTGLGLHTVQNIIRRVGGEITVASSPEGTTFTITLPSVK